MSSFYKYMLSAAACGMALGLDQASKIFIHTSMELGETWTVIKGFFNIHYIRNPGGAFGLFSAGPEWLRFALFILFPIVCVFVIFLVLRESKSKWETLALGWILGGAFGNYIDRLKLGSVIDFIDWYVSVGGGEWHWPTFNMADSFIVLGVGILITLQLRSRPDQPKG